MDWTAAGLRLKAHYASLAADSGLRTTFRAEQASLGGGFTREDVMNERWHARMAEHRKVAAAVESLPQSTREVLWLAYGEHKWPRDAADAFWYKPIQGSLAGVAVLTIAAVRGAAQDKHVNPAMWIGEVVHRKDRARLRIVKEQAQELVKVAARKLARVLP